MLKTVKELNNRYANENMEVRRIRASGGYPGAIKSLDLTSPRKFINRMDLNIGDYVTCEMQQLPRSGALCLVLRKLDFAGLIGESARE